MKEAMRVVEKEIEEVDEGGTWAQARSLQHISHKVWERKKDLYMAPETADGGEHRGKENHNDTQGRQRIQSMEGAHGEVHDGGRGTNGRSTSIVRDHLGDHSRAKVEKRIHQPMPKKEQ